MTGLETLVLVPLVYGCVSLGRKVLDQSRVIDSQNALIDVQAQAIEALQTTTTTSSANGGGAPGFGAARIATFGLVAISSSLAAFSTARWYLNSQQRSQPTEGILRRPGEHYTPAKATGDADECKVCCEFQRDTLLMPCHHFALCWSCAEQIWTSQDKKCPMCRAAIDGIQFTYVA